MNFNTKCNKMNAEKLMSTMSKFVGGLFKYITNIVVPSGRIGIHGCLQELDYYINKYPPVQWYTIAVHDDHVHNHHMCPNRNHSCRCSWIVSSPICAKYGVRRLRRVTRGVDLGPTNYAHILRYLSQGDRFIHRIAGFSENGGLCNRYQYLSNEGHKEASSIPWSPFEILNGRIVDSNVKPTYRIIGTDVTSYKTIYNYSCTLYGLYVEGKGSKKEKAKEDAATEMIRQILNEQNAKTLPNHFKPFNEQEINDLQALLKTKQNYTEFLEETTKEDIPLPLEIKSKVRRT